jgi:alkylation response protein AidB-like acyl-CoA dehydrogenase
MTTDIDTVSQDVRSRLQANIPVDWREAAIHDQFVTSQRAWFKALVAAGYAIPHWPKEWPGGGRSLADQKVIY